MMITRFFSFIKTTSFLIILCVSLLTTTISLAAWTLSLSAQVATMTASAAATAIANRKAIASAVAKTKTRMTLERKKSVSKAVIKTKSKARLRRFVVAVPFVGALAVAEFERRDFNEWKKENPEGDLQAYGCEVSVSSAELIDEVLQELPENIRPSRDVVLSQLPQC